MELRTNWVPIDLSDAYKHKRFHNRSKISQDGPHIFIFNRKGIKFRFWCKGQCVSLNPLMMSDAEPVSAILGPHLHLVSSYGVMQRRVWWLCRFWPRLLTVCWRFIREGKPSTTKTDDFSELFQTAFKPPKSQPLVLAKKSKFRKIQVSVFTPKCVFFLITTGYLCYVHFPPG